MRPGAVIVDCAIDQGGCVEGIHETTHTDPVFERHGVLHYAVGNIPGAVPHTSTYALTNATLPYAVALATRGVRDAVSNDPALAAGVNTADGQVVNPAVADALGRESAPLTDALPDSSGYGVRPASAARRSATGASSATATGWANMPALRQSSLSMACATWYAMRHGLGIEIGALTGRLGEVPRVRGDVEDGDVDGHARRHLAERQLHHLVHGARHRRTRRGAVGGAVERRLVVVAEAVADHDLAELLVGHLARRARRSRTSPRRAVMWFSTSRTVHASHGDGLSSCVGLDPVDHRPGGSRDAPRCIVAASSMTPPRRQATAPTDGHYEASFVGRQHLDQLVEPAASRDGHPRGRRRRRAVAAAGSPGWGRRASRPSSTISPLR